MLSLDSDKVVHELAWNMAVDLRANTAGLTPTDYEQQAIFGMMHAIAPRLRTYVEIGELVERMGITRVYIPLNKLFNAYCLRGFLNRALDYSLRAPSPAVPAKSSKPVKRWPELASLTFAEADARGRPFANRAIVRLKGELSTKLGQETLKVPPYSNPEIIAKLSPMKVASLYGRLRSAGLHRSASLSVALAAAIFDGGMLAHLNRIASLFQVVARRSPDTATIAVNMGRLPVLFALSGAQAGGGRTVAIETMLITRLRRYPVFEPDDHVVLDAGQTAILRSAGSRSRVHACGSMLIEARAEEIKHSVLPVPRILIATQPSDREMRQIMALASMLPSEAEVQIGPHSEDQAAFRAWLFEVSNHLPGRGASLVEPGAESLTHASVVITATSNIAILAQALKIPAILVAARRHLEDAFSNGPYPGLWVDPEEQDAAARFQDSCSCALSGALSDYREINEVALSPGVSTRIAEALQRGG
ncbi:MULTISPECIES: hypothetical protein [unclassified Rhizobium]|uniref:hypothetical protein n=1 Tax=unclassified Rhizobium TaxID=2613769 RepID=UPI001AE132EB|nr:MULTISPECIES: hypothetical protein [unclassified Rhizobium]MBP2460164.1 hypothetical protein [Rhizobium sp. PvP014]MBP2531523.1 hypothetical protein [Rhizobium sp. PvP099]